MIKGLYFITLIKHFLLLLPSLVNLLDCSYFSLPATKISSVIIDLLTLGSNTVLHRLLNSSKLLRMWTIAKESSGLNIVLLTLRSNTVLNRLLLMLSWVLLRLATTISSTAGSESESTKWTKSIESCSATKASSKSRTKESWITNLQMIIINIECWDCEWKNCFTWRLSCLHWLPTQFWTCLFLLVSVSRLSLMRIDKNIIWRSEVIILLICKI